MTPNEGCSRRRRAALVLVTIWPSSCAMGTSDPGGPGVCPLAFGYSRGFQVRAVEELDLLPDGSAIAEMPAVHAVRREQAGGCRAR